MCFLFTPHLTTVLPRKVDKGAMFPNVFVGALRFEVVRICFKNLKFNTQDGFPWDEDRYIYRSMNG